MAYADKRAGQRLESMDARFASWRRRYPRVSVADGQDAGWEDDALKAVRRRADRLEADVCRAAGIEPSEVGQLALDRRGAARPRGGGRDVTTSPLLYVWGDDDLGLERTVDRFAAALAAEGGTPLERWDLRGELAAATAQLAALHERLATPVMFGGGTLAVVANVGRADPAATRAATRCSTPSACSRRATRSVILDATKSGAKAPSPEAPRRRDRGRRRRDPELARRRRAASSPAGSSARHASAGSTSAPGAARSSPSGSAASSSEGDVERQHQTPDRVDGARQARARTATTAPVTVDDVRALVAEAVPGSIWAFADAVGERKTRPALALLERLLDDDAGAGPPRRPPPAGPRAARARRPPGARRERSRPRRGRWASTASSGPSTLAAQARALDRPRSSTARSTASSSSTRWSRARPATSADAAQRAWRSRCG